MIYIVDCHTLSSPEVSDFSRFLGKFIAEKKIGAVGLHANRDFYKELCMLIERINDPSTRKIMKGDKLQYTLHHMGHYSPDQEVGLFCGLIYTKALGNAKLFAVVLSDPELISTLESFERRYKNILLPCAYENEYGVLKEFCGRKENYIFIEYPEVK